MDQKLDEAMCRDFPLLYKQRGGSAQETCMYWGLAVGDGWEPLLRELSAKLEKLIERQVAEADPDVCDCGCFKHTHEDNTGKCSNKFFNRLGEERACGCKAFELKHAQAAQVKEKFGSLRFYLDGGTEEMHNLIDEAERASSVICEDCGKPGKMRKGGWIRCLCDEHAGGKESFKEEELF